MTAMAAKTMARMHRQRKDGGGRSDPSRPAADNDGIIHEHSEVEGGSTDGSGSALVFRFKGERGACPTLVCNRGSSEGGAVPRSRRDCCSLSESLLNLLRYSDTTTTTLMYACVQTTLAMATMWTTRARRRRRIGADDGSNGDDEVNNDGARSRQEAQAAVPL